ncbi:hypothetical protein AHiyo6_36770 [Arthrobacter sp. Hiyo6]|nr:hypothetical protein AHiyo6_36770 [Arthrobacter sp. Hiyo6]
MQETLETRGMLMVMAVLMVMVMAVRMGMGMVMRVIVAVLGQRVVLGQRTKLVAVIICPGGGSRRASVVAHASSLRCPAPARAASACESSEWLTPRAWWRGSASRACSAWKMASLTSWRACSFSSR